MSYLTETEYERIVFEPIALPQTELRGQNFLRITTLVVQPGQRLELSYLCLQLLKLVGERMGMSVADSSLGFCSVGLLASTMFTSALGLVTLSTVGTATWNADQPVIITAPGTYQVIVYNNCLNIDIAVIVTGAARIFY